MKVQIPVGPAKKESPSSTTTHQFDHLARPLKIYHLDEATWSGTQTHLIFDTDQDIEKVFKEAGWNNHPTNLYSPDVFITHKYSLMTEALTDIEENKPRTVIKILAVSPDKNNPKKIILGTVPVEEFKRTFTELFID